MSDIIRAARLGALVILSALAIIAALAFVRALWRDDHLTLLVLVDAHHYNSYALASEHGEIGVVVNRFELNPGHTYIDPTQPPPPPRTTLRRSSVERTKDMSTLLNRPRIFENAIHSEVKAGRTDTYFALVPDETMVLLAGIWPAWVYLSHRAALARARIGKCPRCGYDLRATPGRCPECGFNSRE